jgi:hypothetical protein
VRSRQGMREAEIGKGASAGIGRRAGDLGE